MSFDIAIKLANGSSVKAANLKLNSLAAGMQVILTDFDSRKVLPGIKDDLATFVGYRDAKGNVVNPQGHMKAWPQDTKVVFSATRLVVITEELPENAPEGTVAATRIEEKEVTIVLHKDPAGFGCFGLGTDNQLGYVAKIQKKTNTPWSRVTAYASPDVIAAVMAKRAEEAKKIAEKKAADEAAKAALEAAQVAPTVEEVTETTEQVTEQPEETTVETAPVVEETTTEQPEQVEETTAAKGRNKRK